MITYATEQNTIIAFFINGTKMYFINLLLHIPTNLPYIWQFNAKKFLDLLTPNLHQFVLIKNPRGQCLRSPSPLWIWMINGAKLGGAIGAMAPLVFWSKSLKKSRKVSESKSCSLEVVPVVSTFVWRQCTWLFGQPPSLLGHPHGLWMFPNNTFMSNLKASSLSDS